MKNERQRRRWQLLLGVLFLLPAILRAQDPPPRADSVALLRARLEQKRDERAQMERMVEALNQVDSVYKIHYPTWVVLDEDLKERVSRVFRMRYPDVRRDTDIVVIANPDANEILEISIGGTRMGRRDAFLNLSDSLFNALLTMDYPLRVITPIPPRRGSTILFGMTPRYAAISASGFGAALMVSTGLGVKAELGREEIGYHFWSTGDVRVWLVFKALEIGIIAPMTIGRSSDQSILQPLSIRPRLMTGVKGFTAGYEYPFDQNAVGVNFSVGEMNVMTTGQLYIDLNAIYSVHTVAQGYFSRTFPLGDGENHVTLTGGMGFHQISTGAAQPDGRIVVIKKDDFFSPILRGEFAHTRGTAYGLTLQYYSNILFAHSWIELVTNLIFLDVKFYSRMFRDALPWEQPYFFMLSPRLQLIY